MTRKNKALLALARRKQAAMANMERLSGDLQAAEARLDEIHSMELEMERPGAVKGKKPPKGRVLVKQGVLTAEKVNVADAKAAFEKMREAANRVDQHATPT